MHLLFAAHLRSQYGGDVSHDPSFGAVHWTTDDGLTVDVTMVRVEQYLTVKISLSFKAVICSMTCVDEILRSTPWR